MISKILSLHCDTSVFFTEHVLVIQTRFIIWDIIYWYRNTTDDEAAQITGYVVSRNAELYIYIYLYTMIIALSILSITWFAQMKGLWHDVNKMRMFFFYSPQLCRWSFELKYALCWMTSMLWSFTRLWMDTFSNYVMQDL